jgi:hypothetical protein
MTTFDTEAILADLHDDDDVHKFTDEGEWTFTLHIDQDECLTYEDNEDPEVFGKVQYADQRRTNDFGYHPRPDGFTGAARRFYSESSQGDVYWYEPPKDFRRFKGSGFNDIDKWREAARRHFENVKSVVSWGYVQVGVIASHVRPDGYQRKWSEWIGGVENPVMSWGPERKQWDDYIHGIVGELLTELISQIEGD